MIVDPRRTGTVQGFEDVDPNNSYHAQLKPNADITLLNNIAYILLEEHDDIIAWDFLKENVTGWEAYIDGIVVHCTETIGGFKVGVRAVN